MMSHHKGNLAQARFPLPPVPHTPPEPNHATSRSLSFCCFCFLLFVLFDSFPTLVPVPPSSTSLPLCLPPPPTYWSLTTTIECEAERGVVNDHPNPTPGHPRVGRTSFPEPKPGVGPGPEADAKADARSDSFCDTFMAQEIVPGGEVSTAEKYGGAGVPDRSAAATRHSSK
jgi:hypothetical protein